MPEKKELEVFVRDPRPYDGGLGRTRRKELIAAERYPAPVQISDRRWAWIESKLIAWQQERIAERDAD